MYILVVVLAIFTGVVYYNKILFILGIVAVIFCVGFGMYYMTEVMTKKEKLANFFKQEIISTYLKYQYLILKKFLTYFQMKNKQKVLETFHF